MREKRGRRPLRGGVECALILRMPTRRDFLAAVPPALLLACGGAPEEAAEAPAETPAGKPYWVFFGPYTRETSKGIYRSRFDAATGELSDAELAAEMENPSFLTIHPNGKYLYAVAETNEGSVDSYALDGATGALTKINTQPTQGGSPCDLEVDHTGKMLVVANYGGGSTIAYQVGEDGSLSAPSDFHQHEGSSTTPRQKGPHAHSVDFSADNRFVMVSDLGLDKVLVYEADVAAGKLKQVGAAVLPPGSGPRHFAFHPSNKYAFSLGEIASTVTSFSYDAATGGMTLIETISTLPEDFDGKNTTAEIQVHPSGKFLYASNRGHHSLALIQIDEATGKIERKANYPTLGETPRNFNIAPGGEYLLAANQDSDNVVVFQLDPATGELKATGRQIAVSMPVCIVYHPAG
ncbi:MAG: beta-propeller fold lactonase family protein [Acidobacteria bacterium]|nr:beta-propeller fold lactonase family protein [Acidobacteriota bacterium]